MSRGSTTHLPLTNRNSAATTSPDQLPSIRVDSPANFIKKLDRTWRKLDLKENVKPKESALFRTSSPSSNSASPLDNPGCISPQSDAWGYTHIKQLRKDSPQLFETHASTPVPAWGYKNLKELRKESPQLFSNMRERVASTQCSQSIAHAHHTLGTARRRVVTPPTHQRQSATAPAKPVSKKTLLLPTSKPTPNWPGLRLLY